MNILFLSHRIPYPPNKGEKIRTYHQICYLANAGHSIGVLCPYDSNEDDQLLQSLAKKLLSIKSSLHPLSVFRLVLGYFRGQPLSVANFYSDALQQEFDRIISQEKIDTIICTSSAMAEYINRSETISKSNRKPVLIMDFMDLDSQKWKQYAESASLLKRWIYKREFNLLSKYERHVANIFDSCLFISNEEVKLFCQDYNGSGKIQAIGNGIDTEFFRPIDRKSRNQDPKLLFTGVMDYLPNEDAVCWFVNDIWPDVRNRWPKAEFYIAGMSPSPKVQKLEKIPGIVVTGKVEDIRVYYDKADLFIAPLRIARGVQNKILQAFACGLPVVSTPAGNEGISAIDHEHLRVEENPKEFAKAINQLLENKSHMQTMGNNARELVEQKFSWDGQLKGFTPLLSKEL